MRWFWKGRGGGGWSNKKGEKKKLDKKGGVSNKKIKDKKSANNPCSKTKEKEMKQAWREDSNKGDETKYDKEGPLLHRCVFYTSFFVWL